ncbi:hypothetical protein [Cylindrospermopsis raciborskii]|uniref:hypothetical protein n=1 Tax=Cylindrospermopsis raciborskii TaxID=77022 RepID=UPI000778CAAB|nr:hypothetical protein [Cylindrospermopsis raciborskii]
MNSQYLEIHEFSTGIHVQRRDNGWVSVGFTGKYMNSTIDPIPTVVERSIANEEFALTEGSSAEKPAIVGRVLKDGDDIWSVIAVVSRGKDEVGRSAGFYRYFLCRGDNNLRLILAWWEEKGQPRFNPLEAVQKFHIFTGEAPRPLRKTEDMSLPFEESDPIVLAPETQQDLYTLNSLAIRKANSSNNKLPVSWAFNVEGLAKPGRFQIIQPSSQKAYKQIKEQISNYRQNEALIDEAALKSALRGLINSSQVKPEAVGVIVNGVTNKEITPEYWEHLFNSQGANQGIRQKIYSPQMVKLVTLRALVLPKTLPEFLGWLNIQASKKVNQNQMVSLQFQQAIKELFPKEKVAEGIGYLLPSLLDGNISPDGLSWLLAKNGSNSIWSYAQKQFVNDVRNDLQLIFDQYKNSKSLNFDGGNLKCEIGVWNQLIRGWQGIQRRYYKCEEYRPLAELFEEFREDDLAAYFYQVSDGLVNKKLFGRLADSQRSGYPVVFGLPIKRKETLIDVLIKFINQFVNQDIDMKILYVAPISLLILGSGWFVGSKTWHAYVSQNDINNHLCKESQKPENCSVIVLDDTKHYSFKDIQRIIPQVVDDLVKKREAEEKKKYEEANSSGVNQTPPSRKSNFDIKAELINKVNQTLPKILADPTLKYDEIVSPIADSNIQSIQRKWLIAVYNYQIKHRAGKEIKKVQGEECKLGLFGLCFPGQEVTVNKDEIDDSPLRKRLAKDINYAIIKIEKQSQSK